MMIAAKLGLTSILVIAIILFLIYTNAVDHLPGWVNGLLRTALVAEVFAVFLAIWSL